MIVSCDAAQLEWRTAVELSNDKTGLAEILEKQDTHSLNQKAFELPSRLIAKIYLFRTIFRGSGWAFANDPEFMHVSSSAKYWDAVNEKFYSKYDGLDRKHSEWSELVVNGLPILGPMGRSWKIEMARHKKTGELQIPWTTLSNYPVQGTGADIMKLARVMFYKRIKKLGIPCLFITTVHDSIVVDVEEKYVAQVVALFHQVFADLPKQIYALFGYTWNVPLECECKVGPNFKDLVKVS
jgi:DNA polymerase-1